MVGGQCFLKRKDGKTFEKEQTTKYFGGRSLE
jgi:hypothetical protein